MAVVRAHVEYLHDARVHIQNVPIDIPDGAIVRRFTLSIGGEVIISIPFYPDDLPDPDDYDDGDDDDGAGDGAD